MSRYLSLAVAGLAVLGWQGALAKSVTCNMASLERTVELRYVNPGEAVPCEVRYAKPTEGWGEQVLWRAEHEAGYCEARFDEFVDKLEGFGWSCGVPTDETPGTRTDDDADETEPESSPAAPADEPEAAEDTPEEASAP